MFNIVAFLFFFILIILFIGLSFVGSILRVLFGFGRRHSSTGSYQRTGSYQSGSQNSTDYTSSSSQNKSSSEADNQTGKHKKIFSKEEGEYVDFEEIK